MSTPPTSVTLDAGPVTGVPAAPVPAPRRSGFDWGRLVRYALLLGFVILVLIPVYVMLVTSFKDVTDAAPSRAWFLPQNWTLENWSKAFFGAGPANPSIGQALWRTLCMVVPAAVISSFLGSMNGFVLSRWRFPGANVVFTLLLFGMFIPYQSVMVPLYQIMMKLWQYTPLKAGTPTLILLHVIYGIPITTLIFRNYYETVPKDMIEAAKVDGAGMFGTYLR
ncbi:MAG: carbohydrate ABC transporter permease, partial [Propionibacteriaceae bacterium]|nr:carbohydrate ABC transporter permease [Propionibacteriaceae bacterium]